VGSINWDDLVFQVVQFRLNPSKLTGNKRVLVAVIINGPLNTSLSIGVSALTKSPMVKRQNTGDRLEPVFAAVASWLRVRALLQDEAGVANPLLDRDLQFALFD